jgi:hypothetical protein
LLNNINKIIKQFKVELRGFKALLIRLNVPKITDYFKDALGINGVNTTNEKMKELKN